MIGIPEEIAHDFTYQFWGHHILSSQWNDDCTSVIFSGFCQQKIKLGHLILYKNIETRLSAVRVTDTIIAARPRDRFQVNAVLPESISEEEWGLIHETSNYSKLPISAYLEYLAKEGASA